MAAIFEQGRSARGAVLLNAKMRECDGAPYVTALSRLIVRRNTRKVGGREGQSTRRSGTCEMADCRYVVDIYAYCNSRPRVRIRKG